MNIQTIDNVSDCVPLYLPHSLYLKPLAKFNISVSLPASKICKNISNYDIMDKLTKAIRPDKCLVLKVSKSTLEFIRFDGELEDRTKLRNVLSRLDGLSFKLTGFTDSFKVRAAESRDDFPSRHDWDSFFRDARNMDEMKPGERPDTIHISNLPIHWFCPRHMENDENVKPSENIFKRIFEKFGSVRCVDIPICDLYRSHMKTEIAGMKTFNFDHGTLFEGYIQFSEYVGFVKAMDEFRGMKLVRKLGDKNQGINISVTFDKTKHLSDASIKRRNIVRDRLIAKEKAKEEQEIKRKKQEIERIEQERKKQEELKQKELQLQKEREERRREKHLRKLQEKGKLDLTKKIRLEEKKLLIAQRKLESIRLLEALFTRLKLKQNETVKEKMKIEQINKVGEESDLRNKLVKKFKTDHEKALLKQKRKLNNVKSRTGLLALLEGDKETNRSPSINTISSDDSVLSDSHIDKKNKINKQKLPSDTSDSDSETDSITKKNIKKMKKLKYNTLGPLYNPELAAEWLKMGMYSYAPPIFPGIAPVRPGFFPNTMPYRGNFPYRSRFPRGRGRNAGRRGHYKNNFHYDPDQYYKYFKRTAGIDDDEHSTYQSEQERRRSESHSRSRSSRSSSRYRSKYHRSRQRSRSRSRSETNSRKSYSRSYSKSRSKRSYTRSDSYNKSRRKSRSKSSKPKQKLVSTRRSRTASTSSPSKSRSRSRSRSWSSNYRGNHIVLKTDKLVRSAKEIQRSVQEKLHNRYLNEENNRKHDMDRNESSISKKRSTSVDSSSFKPPQRKTKSITPEKEWK